MKQKSSIRFEEISVLTRATHISSILLFFIMHNSINVEDRCLPNRKEIKTIQKNYNRKR